jgi:hypothetical protein
MPQAAVVKCQGLYTHPDPLSDQPEGALSKADNVVIDREGIAESRRGLGRFGNGFATSSDRCNQLAFYDGYVISHHGASELAYALSGGSWTTYATAITPPDSSTPVRFSQSNSNLYLTSDNGIYRLSAFNGILSLAGAPQGLDIDATVGSSGSGFLANNEKVAYRILWGFKDDNDNLILGAPSGRETASNTSGSSQNVDLDFAIPDSVTTSFFFQVYRSKAVSSSATPSDELFLVYEANPSGAEITAGTVSYTDEVDETLLGTTIYTAPSQETISQSNFQPPLAKDIVNYQGYTFYFNTQTKHRFELSLISVGASNGIQVDDTVVIGGVTYTGKASESIVNAEFTVVTSGSVAQNIEDTAENLCKVINRHSSSSVYAYYISGPNDLPGKILLEEKSLSSSAFTVQSTRNTAFLPSGIDTAQSSTNDDFINGVSFSKNLQPEHVPLANSFRVGSAKSAILRAKALRESILIFKEDGGVFRLTGNSPSSFNVTQLDSSVNLWGAETVDELNNRIYCLTDQGVVAVTESGVSVMSRPIEQSLRDIQAESLDNLKTLSFGVAYESERKFILFVPTNAADTTPTQAYVYNTFTNTWTRWALSCTTGGVNPVDDKLHLGSASSGGILHERKDLNLLDYMDFRFQQSITSINTVDSSTIVLTIDGNSDNVNIGDIVFQSNTIYAQVTATDPINSTVTVGRDPGFTVATCDFFEAIPTKIAWKVVTFDNPGQQKHYRSATLLFNQAFSATATVNFRSDFSLFDDSITLTSRTGSGGWGLDPWGQFPWGGPGANQPYNMLVPRRKMRCTQLTIEFVYAQPIARFALSGVAIEGEIISDRVSL